MASQAIDEGGQSPGTMRCWEIRVFVNILLCWHIAQKNFTYWFCGNFKYVSVLYSVILAICLYAVILRVVMLVFFLFVILLFLCVLVTRNLAVFSW